MSYSSLWASVLNVFLGNGHQKGYRAVAPHKDLYLFIDLDGATIVVWNAMLQFENFGCITHHNNSYERIE
jgi:hypothetical protein